MGKTSILHLATYLMHLTSFTREMTEKGKEILEYGDDIISVESDDENVVDSTSISGDDMLVGDGAIVPKVSMKFKDANEMFEFYKRYAYKIVFPIRKRNSRKDDDGVLRNITFVCCREGKRIRYTSGSLKSQATIQSGCKARITGCSDICRICKINTVHLYHNHKTSPSKSRLHQCNRELSAHVKRQLEVNNMAGISLHKSYNSAVVERDCRNYVEKVRRL